MLELEPMRQKRRGCCRAALVAAIVLGLGGAAHAAPLSVSWQDVGDVELTATAPDLLSISLEFDNANGDYTIRLTASAARPFEGDFRVNVNTFNVDDASRFGDTVNDFFGVAATTALELSGNNSVLLGWEAGDRVAHCANAGLCNTPFEIPGAFVTGLTDVPPFDPQLIAELLVSEQGFSTVVPEPTTVVLLGMGLLGAGFCRRR